MNGRNLVIFGVVVVALGAYSMTRPAPSGVPAVKIAAPAPDPAGEARAIAAVKAAVLTVPDAGKSSLSVKKSIELFARAPGFKAEKWSAQQNGNQWTVSLAVVDAGKEKWPKWSYDPHTREVHYLDDLSKTLSWAPGY